MSSTTSSAVGTQSPAEQYLQLSEQRLFAARADLPRLIEMGQQMADPLLAGGQLCCGRVANWWPSEWCGRAGGLMGITRGRPERMTDNDIALFALPANLDSDENARRQLDELMNSPAKLFAIADDSQVQAAGLTDRFTGVTGGVDWQSGAYQHGKFAPLTPIWPLDMILRGWLATGEMVAACLRGGKMPIVYMSVWLEGAFVRNAMFRDSDTLREPYEVPLFHNQRFVPPLPPGQVGNEFLDAIEAIYQRLAAQTQQLATAGRMIADTLKAGKRARAVLVGHAYPWIFDLPANEPAGDYPIEWGRSNSNLSTVVPEDFGPGDTMLHLGYGPFEVAQVQAILDRGVKLIHTSPYGKPDGLPNDPNFLWFDLPWRPADATVDIPGYSVRILPTSSSVQTIAYHAILSEVAELMNWK